MAPNLTADQHALIQGMLSDGSLSYAQIALKIPCSKKSIQRISANLHCYGTTTAPRNGGGRPRRMTPQMLATLHAELERKPYLLLNEMANLLQSQFPDEERPSLSTISRSLRRSGLSRKIACHTAKERDPDIRDMYVADLAVYDFKQLVCIDESGADKKDGFRRYGRAPRGRVARQVTRLQRGPRYQILAAYCYDGILHSNVSQGTTDSAKFEDFIADLLLRCETYPQPKSVLVMDNASIHHSASLERLCAAAGVKLIFLAPYSPDLNPIELFFGRLKKFIQRHWIEHEDTRYSDFGGFLQWCVDRVGQDWESARNEFKHAGILIND